MIYVLVGDDLKSKSIYIKALIENREIFVVLSSEITKDLIMNYAGGVSLFGESPVLITENVIKEGLIDFENDELEGLKESKTIFIFKEDKLLAQDQKKYKKFGVVENFETKKITQNNKFNVFSITDFFARKDKMDTWTLYQNAIVKGTEPEVIAGVLFWKIKMMILNGSKTFSIDELKYQSSSIVSVYHNAHKGAIDFVVGLEQFILSSLSSK